MIQSAYRNPHAPAYEKETTNDKDHDGRALAHNSSAPVFEAVFPLEVDIFELEMVLQAFHHGVGLLQSLVGTFPLEGVENDLAEKLQARGET